MNVKLCKLKVQLEPTEGMTTLSVGVHFQMCSISVPYKVVAASASVFQYL